MKSSIGKVLRLSAAVLSLGLCTGAYAEPVAHFDYITHAPDSDAWWNTVKNGIKQADEDFNVQTDYRNPPNGDIADMVRLVDQAAARNYDGVVLTIADFDLLKNSVLKLKAKNIPFITANTGTEQQSADLGALMHVGQPEYLAGKEAGLRSHPNTQAVLTLGPTSADPTIRAVTKLGLAGKIWFATFDIDSDVAKAIKDGTIKFCTDQQPYLQGYIPVAMLAIMHKNHNTDVAQARAELEKNPKVAKVLKDYGLKPVYEARNISSGPGFITPQNIEQVSSMAGRYR
jgi:simple sugar transport system substrate-binding protein